MKVAVAYAGPEGEALVEVEVPANATLADAVERSGLVAHYRLDGTRIGFAIFGQRATPQVPLRDGDRVELLRPLRADPKAARAARAARAAENPLQRPRPRAPRRVRTR